MRAGRRGSWPGGDAVGEEQDRLAALVVVGRLAALPAGEHVVSPVEYLVKPENEKDAQKGQKTAGYDLKAAKKV